MHTKIVLFFIILIVSSFFYLHTVNPSEVNFYIAKSFTYTLPITVLVFLGFIFGVALTAINTLVADLRRAVKDIASKRNGKILSQAEESFHSGVDEFYRGNRSKGIELVKKSHAGMVQGKAIMSREVALKLSELYIKEGLFDSALSLLDKEISKEPKNIELLFLAVDASARARDGEKASRLLTSILRVDKENERALNELRDIFISREAWSDAVKYQKKIVKLFGKNSSSERELLSALFYEEAQEFFNLEDFEKAEVSLKDSLKNFETFVPALLLSGEIKLKSGDRVGAEKIWKTNFEKLQKVIFLLYLEEFYLSNSDPDKIIQLYLDAIISTPDNVKLKLLLSRLYLRLESVDKAITELEPITKDSVEGFYGHLLLGEAYLRRSNGEGAALSFQKALGFDKELPPPFLCDACGKRLKSWSGRCPNCALWGKVRMGLNLTCQNLTEKTEAPKEITE
ncbi:MAG: tetratricopeptide repeat protein [Deltaproteobacteria bacterium]|nr:tetratricopeptide repeat protein [Deltaproteobacteria bacterium]